MTRASSGLRRVIVAPGAVAVHASLLRLLRRRGPTAASLRIAAARGAIDARLVLGSAVFGVGWGLSGYCPGPSIVALGFGAVRPFAYVAAVIAGMLLAGRLPGAGAGARREP